MSTKNYFDIECLITEVQCRPILWQDNHKDYKNKSITDLVWEDVGKQCNCSGKMFILFLYCYVIKLVT